MPTVGPLLRALLERYGLTSLTDWASEMAIQGVSEDELLIQLYDRPEVDAAYPWIKQRQAAGMTPMTIEEGLVYGNSLRQAGKLYGVNVTQDEINKLIAGDVSVNEAVEDRLAPVSSLIHMMPAGVRAQVNTLYGIDEEDLMRTWMDPKENAQTLRKRLTAAQIAAEGMATAFGQINAAQAERLAMAGFDDNAAREAFAKLTQQQELFRSTDVTEDVVDTDTQIGLLTGDQEAAKLIERRIQRRTGQFGQGGGFATSNKGIVGLGSAS